MCIADVQADTGAEGRVGMYVGRVETGMGLVSFIIGFGLGSGWAVESDNWWGLGLELSNE